MHLLTDCATLPTMAKTTKRERSEEKTTEEEEQPQKRAKVKVEKLEDLYFANEIIWKWEKEPCYYCGDPEEYGFYLEKKKKEGYF